MLMNCMTMEEHLKNKGKWAWNFNLRISLRIRSSGDLCCIVMSRDEHQTPWWVTLSNSTATAADHCFHQIQLDSWEVLHCRNTEQQSGPSVKPSLSLLPPSSLQLSEGSASLLCLLSGYSPQGAQVSWTVDGSEVKEGVLTSIEEEKNGRYSTLTLSKALWEKGEVFVCTVSHDSVNLPVVLVKSVTSYFSASANFFCVKVTIKSSLKTNIMWEKLIISF
ncbi:hypothetical protein MHYP_G00315310 [Metynnis hypsauchen]